MMQRYRRYILTFLWTLLFGFPLFAQQGAQRITLSGYVCDSITGERLEFITLQEKGTTNGTITNTDGSYSLLLRSNGVLVASCVGYRTKEVSASGKSRKEVIMLTSSRRSLSDPSANTIAAVAIRRWN